MFHISDSTTPLSNESRLHEWARAKGLPRLCGLQPMARHRPRNFGKYKGAKTYREVAQIDSYVKWCQGRIAEAWQQDAISAILR